MKLEKGRSIQSYSERDVVHVCVCACAFQACFLVMLADCSGENRASAARALAMCCEGEGQDISSTADITLGQY